MQTVKSELEKAKEYRSNQNIDASISIYDKLWASNKREFNQWDCWYYADCLIKKNVYNKALLICEDLILNYPNFDPIKTLLVKGLYYMYIKPDDNVEETKFFESANRIVSMTSQKDKYLGFYYINTVFKVLNKYKSPFRALKVLEWLDKIEDPESLESTPFSYIDKDGNSKEIASKREAYYSLMAKAFFKENRFQECIGICKNALSSFPVLHYNNDIWFNRWIALSEAKLGNLDSGLEKLNALLINKKEWFLLLDISKIQIEKGNRAEAIKALLDASLLPGDYAMKLEVYLTLGKLLEEQSMIDEYKSHISLTYQIRKEKEWKINQELLDLITKYQIEIQSLSPSIEIYKSLRPFWKKLKYKGQTQYKGVISNILPNRKAGFIQSDTQSYYFKIFSFNGRISEIQKGLEVTFYLEEGFDSKKRIATKNAVNIEKI